MSWNKQFSLVVAAVTVVLSVPEFAHAQRGGRGGGGGRGNGGGGRVVAARPIGVTPYAPYAPYAPYYFFDPFFWGMGWGYPGWYGPGSFAPGFVAESNAKLQVEQKQAEVYVDGYLAGVVDDFDGFGQSLRLAPGEHVIELYLDGHKSISQPILFQPGKTFRIKHSMQPLAAGDVAPVRPTPKKPE